MTLPLQQSAHDQTEAVVEAICALGCAAVYRTMEQMEDGADLEVLAGCSPEVYATVLLELKSVMAVYDAREGGPVCKLSQVPVSR